MVLTAARGRALAWLALVAWLGLRMLGTAGSSAYALALPGSSLIFFHVDLSFVPLVLAVALWLAHPPSARSAWLASGALALVSAATFLLATSRRYYAGEARAWDLANYVQPMWRAAHGLSMTNASYHHRPVWADHGAYAMFLFAPFTRLDEHAAIGLFVVQSVLAGACLLTMFGLTRALGGSTGVALAATSVLASSRALAHAARFDFHPECALPLLLLGLAWAHARGRTVAALLLTVLAITLRDVAALTVCMLWLYWALAERSPRALVPALLAAAVAAFDMLLLPRWTGWQPYVAMHGSLPIDLSMAVSSSAFRALSTFGIGWLHPIAWLTGAPWLAAAGLSPKLLVKGIDFQYGFLFVPVAALGAAHVLVALERRRRTWLALAVSAWVALAVGVNAPLPISLPDTLAARSAHGALTRQLAELVPRGARVAADACSAPYLIERADLTLLCRLDGRRLQTTGVELWEEPVPDALAATTHVVVRQDCEASGPCVNEQLKRGQRERGLRVSGRAAPFVVLQREVAGVGR
jgi:uncharacterized membrane protein